MKFLKNFVFDLQRHAAGGIVENNKKKYWLAYTRFARHLE